MKKLEYISADKTLNDLAILISECYNIDLELARKVFLDSLSRCTATEEIIQMSDYTMDHYPPDDGKLVTFRNVRKPVVGNHN